MKKVLLLATAAMFITGVSFADGGKKKNTKKCAKASCHKGCCKDKAEKTTAKM